MEQVNASPNANFVRHYYDIYEKVIVDSAEHCIQEIKEQENLGFDELVINPSGMFTNNTATETIKTMEIIGEKILSEFPTAATASAD